MKHFIKKHKFVNKWLLAVSLFVCVMAVGVTVAYMFRKTASIKNIFQKSEVSCEVTEEFDDISGTKSSIIVRNTGNVSAFLRVRLISYWEDVDGNIIGKPSEMPEIVLATGWRETEENTYEYEKAVAPGASTTNLLKEDSSIILSMEENGERQVLEVFAEAIQSEPTDAKDVW